MDNGEWCFDQDILQIEAVDFFGMLYGNESVVLRAFPSNVFPHLTDHDAQFLSRTITDDEIKKALFGMALLKVPESDGFHVYFFQSQ